MVKKVIAGVYGLLVLSGFLDVFSGGAVFPLIVDYWVYVVLFLIGVLTWRLYQKPDITASFLRVNSRFLLPVILGFTVLLFGFDVYQHSETYIVTPEAIRATSAPHIVVGFGFNLKSLVSFLMLLYGVRLLFTSGEKLRSYWPMHIFFGFLLICFFLFIQHTQLFLEISRSFSKDDDNTLMETLQVIILLIGSGICGWLGYHHKTTTFRVIYFLSALVLLFFAGEELSWGQHILSVNYPTLEGNYQNEFNVHNQRGVNEIVVFMYVAAFWYAVLSWLTRRAADRYALVKKKHVEWWDLCCFRGQEVLYFFPTLLFNPYFGNDMLFGIPSVESAYVHFGLVPDIFKTREFVHRWKETFEVLFYAGIVIHFYMIFHKAREKSN